MPLTWNSIRWILLKSHRRDICHLGNLLLLHMSIWGTSVRGEVSKGKHALVFQMNTARLEPEGFLQRLTPKNLFLVLKQLQLLKIQLLLFLAQLLVLDMLLLPYPLPLVHLYSLGRVQGHTHKHTSKAKSRKPHFPDAGLRLLGQNSSKQCGILYVAEAGWVKDDKTQQEEGKGLHVLWGQPLPAYQTGKMLLLCTATYSLAWTLSQNLNLPNLYFSSYSDCKTLQIY